MALEGGLRDRLIFQSLYNSLETYLDSLDWFDAPASGGGSRYHSQVTMVDENPDENDEVDVNTLAMSMGDGSGRDVELGSKLEEHEIAIFVDFYAEDDAVGRHLIGDVYEYFRTYDIQTVYDYSGDPEEVGFPSAAFTVYVMDDIDKRKPERAIAKWQKHWYVCSFSVTDDRDHVVG